MRKIILFCALFFYLARPEAAEGKKYQFRIDKCNISSVLHDDRRDSTVFISYRLLEILLKKELLKLGVTPSDRKNVPLVECQGSTIFLNGKVKGFDFMFEVDFRFYQKDNQKDPYRLFVDCKIQMGSREASFLECLAAVVALPIHMVMESVINIVLASTSINGGVEDYFEIKAQGGLSPLSFLSRLGNAFLNLFRKKKEFPKHRVAVNIDLLPRARKVLNKIQNFEFAPINKGFMVHFY